MENRTRIGRKPIYWPNYINVMIRGTRVIVTRDSKNLYLIESKVLPHLNHLCVQFFDTQHKKTIYASNTQSLELHFPKSHKQDIACFDDSQFKAWIACSRTIINNMIIGVTVGFYQKLRIVGVGYKASTHFNEKTLFSTGILIPYLLLRVGYSHPIKFYVPVKMQVKTKGSEIIISGINKRQITSFAAEVRAMRPPEPYKGKGIFYENEFVTRKVGKSAKSGKAGK